MSAPRMDWDDLRFVLAIAQAGSLSGAARKLGVNHATVFRRLKAMEDGIGVRLFEKHSDGFVTTPAGDEAVAVAVDLEERVTGLERRIVGRDVGPMGIVRVTTVPEMMFGLLPPIVAQLAVRYPGIRLEIIGDTGSANLSRRDADIAIRFTRSPPEQLIGRRVATACTAIYAAPTFIADQDPAVPLADRSWVGFDEGMAHLPSARWLAKTLGDRLPIVTCNNMTGIARMVEAGLGLGLLPCMLAERMPGLVRVAPPDSDWSTEVWLLTHPDVRDVSRVRAVFDVLAEELVKLRPVFSAAVADTQVD
jgi:molybdate transport repressor ModE-like protein